MIHLFISLLLRCSSSVDHTALASFDVLLPSAFCQITNSDLTDKQWLQASLPIEDGCPGVRRVATMAFPAYSASACSHRGSNICCRSNRQAPGPERCRREGVCVRWRPSHQHQGTRRFGETRWRTSPRAYADNLAACKAFEPVRSLRSSSSHQLSVPRQNSTFGSRAFRFSAPRVWNSLPVFVKLSHFPLSDVIKRHTVFNQSILI